MKSKEQEEELVKTSPKKKGRNKIPDALRLYKDKATRRRINMLRFTRNRLEEGMERGDIIKTLQDEYEISERTARHYYDRAKQLVEYSMTWDADVIRNKNIQRLDNIVEEAMENEDYQNAVKAIDIQNKTASVYIEKKEIAIDGNEIKFSFGSTE